MKTILSIVTCSFLACLLVPQGFAAVPGPKLAVAKADAGSAESAREAGVPLRNLVDIQGVRDNQLVGYGLVVGLAGTGDGTQAKFTIQSLANALKRMGVLVPPASIRVRNAAAVMVTTDLPAFSRPGSRLDVTVSSIGDAKSLSGGTLLMTPMKAPDGRVYALAQGSVSLGGGFAASGGGASLQKNHPTTGTIPSGAIVERTAGIELAGRDGFNLQLRNPNFTTAYRIESALDNAFQPETAHALDSGTVRVTVPTFLRDRPVEALAHILAVNVEPVVPARVVLNERTGTVVMGGDVSISRVSVTHGNLTVSVVESYAVSQPGPFSKGSTVVVPEGEVVATEEEPQHLDFREGTRVEDLVESLKRVGVTPRDMIAIFQAIRSAGALHAELVLN